jgi:hypothetical protein
MEPGKLTDKSKEVLNILNGLTVSEIQTALNCNSHPQIKTVRLSLDYLT